MPSFIPFFDKAVHQVSRLQAGYPSRPRVAALRLGLWSLKKALTGHLLGDVEFLHVSREGHELNLAFLLRGGIGDIIINLSWVDALVSLSGCPCRVDLYAGMSPENLHELCLGMNYIREIHTLKERVVLSRYDAVFDVMQNPQVKAVCRERLELLSPFLQDYTLRLLAFQSSHASFYVDENQAMGIHYADVMGGGRRRQPDFDGSLNLRDSDFTLTCRMAFSEVAATFGLKRPYVTFQWEAGASVHSLKLWSVEKYVELFRAMRTCFPGYDLVFIGVDRHFELPSDVGDYVKDLRGRTSFAELMVLVRHAVLHIGGEGVIPHMRHYLRGGTSLVLFGPSCSRMLGYPENLFLAGSECPNGCEGITATWQRICLKGYDSCHSLEEIQVEDVLRECEHAGLS